MSLSSPFAHGPRPHYGRDRATTHRTDQIVPSLHDDARQVTTLFSSRRVYGRSHLLDLLFLDQEAFGEEALPQ